MGVRARLHLWWARRPLATARAVLFAQMVNDPVYETRQGFTRGVNKKRAELERERLFKIIRELVKDANEDRRQIAVFLHRLAWFFDTRGSRALGHAVLTPK